MNRTSRYLLFGLGIAFVWKWGANQANNSDMNWFSDLSFRVEILIGVVILGSLVLLFGQGLYRSIWKLMKFRSKGE